MFIASHKGPLTRIYYLKLCGLALLLPCSNRISDGDDWQSRGSTTVTEHVVSVEFSSLILHGTFRDLFVLP